MIWNHDPEIVRMDLVLCILSALNICVWVRIAYAFFVEMLSKGRRGFFLIVVIMIGGYLTLNVGVLIIRGVELLHALGVTPDVQYNAVSEAAHMLQIFMGVCMLIAGAVIIELIRHRKR